MTIEPRHYQLTIAALAIACIALAYVAFTPAPPTPTEDPERWRVEERMRMREAQLEVARDSLRVALLRIDTVEVVKWRTKVKHDSVQQVRLSQSDSVQGVALRERLR
jgi:hypothetical protein